MYGFIVDTDMRTSAETSSEKAKKAKAKKIEAEKKLEAKKLQENSAWFSPMKNFNPFDALFASWNNNIQTHNFSETKVSSYGHGVKYNIKTNNQIVNRALSQVGHSGGQKYGAGNAAWCAAFASWVYGGSAAPWGKQRAVSGIKSWAVKKGVYQHGSDFSKLKPGDLVVWRPDTTGRSHVGIVACVKDGKLFTVEGNTTGDKVNTRCYAKGTKFDGFVRLS